MENNYTLRISVTSLCNLNCIYCNTQRVANPRELMSEKDIEDLLRAAFQAGIKKVSWTGGEPTIRPDFLKLVKKAKEIGIVRQSLTTNGILYSKIAEDLREYGLTKINFSLDSLESEKYKKICGYDGLHKVITSIDKAVDLYNKIKINCVVTKSNISIIGEMIDYFDKYNGKVVVRFLEIVPCGQMYEYNKSIFEDQFVSENEMLNHMKDIGELTPVKIFGDVPKSSYFKIKGKRGIYGVNPNFSVGFKCDQKKCPKIRVSPNGFVSNCTINLNHVRDFRNKTLEEKIELMKEIVKEKKRRDYSGFLHRQKYYDFWRFGVTPEYIDKKFKK
ncbi:MAG: radical SAM protein [Candidatus Moranbacteria bacterium]|nr:radical SAM protein [Candidatus Moranbacteria bacterium]